MPSTTTSYSHSLTYPAEGATSWFATAVAKHQAITDNFDAIGTTNITLAVDENGNQVVTFSFVASAVNYLDISNSATGNDVALTAAGDDATIHLSLDGKGASGGVKLAGLLYPYADGSWKQPIITDGSGSLTIGDPHITNIFDSNSNEVVTFTETASAVNYLDIANAATTNSVRISSAGDDANVGIYIAPKGAGQITLDHTSLPATGGTAGQWLQTNGSGAFSWSEVINLINDTSPQLGGNFDPNGYAFIGDIKPSPDEAIDLGDVDNSFQDAFLKRLSFDDGTNYLTNYQVGTWTPAIDRTGTAPTIGGYTVQEGWYVYIGPMVAAWFNLQFTSASGGTGDWFVEGLPANAMNDADYQNFGLAWDFTSSTEDGARAEVLYNSDRIFFFPMNSHGFDYDGWTGSTFRFSGTADITDICGFVIYRSA